MTLSPRIFWLHQAETTASLRQPSTSRDHRVFILCIHVRTRTRCNVLMCIKPHHPSLVAACTNVPRCLVRLAFMSTNHSLLESKALLSLSSVVQFRSTDHEVGCHTLFEYFVARRSTDQCPILYSGILYSGITSIPPSRDGVSRQKFCVCSACGGGTRDHACTGPGRTYLTPTSTRTPSPIPSLPPFITRS